VPITLEQALFCFVKMRKSYRFARKAFAFLTPGATIDLMAFFCKLTSFKEKFN